MALNKRTVESRLKNTSNSNSGLVFTFPPKERTDIVEVEFEYNGPEADILCASPTCGCSDVWVEGKKIKANLKLAAAVSSDKHDVVKTIRAIFGKNINEPQWKISNPDKKLGARNAEAPIEISLTVRGTIK